jgi:glutaconyl-CoA decarboxylase
MNDQVYEMEVELVGEQNQPAAKPAPAPAPVQKPAAVSAAPAAAPAQPEPQAAAGDVVSPMPGTVLKWLCGRGEAVRRGQVVLLLEAMKMENEIPAPKDGTITDIHVHKGDTLQEGDPVVTIA